MFLVDISFRIPYRHTDISRGWEGAEGVVCPVCRQNGGALFVENSKPIIKLSKDCCAFYYPPMAILNIIDDKIFLPRELLPQHCAPVYSTGWNNVNFSNSHDTYFPFSIQGIGIYSPALYEIITI